MLVLSRKEGEQVVIDQDIVVEIIHIRGHRVRLGIEAPRAKRILRKEICCADFEPGQIRRDSAPGKGTHVTVDLPLIEDESDCHEACPNSMRRDEKRTVTDINQPR
ncbi:MAG: carbon storage regulator [Candidatus Nealsonbacteria bacterium]|nr:carbon storage regulator [Candidatus Nealsonbacteria bacterium]